MGKRIIPLNIHADTIGNLLDRIASEIPSKEAIKYPALGLSLTYREFNNLCRKVGKAIIALGVESGEHIAVWAPNIPEWLLLQFGAPKANAVLVPINTCYRVQELRYILQNADVTMLFLATGPKYANEYSDILYELCPELKESQPGKLYSKTLSNLPKLTKVINIGEEKLPGMLNWNDFLSMSDLLEDNKLLERQSEVSPDDVVVIQYTSGTTGVSKGVMLTHNNVLYNATICGERIGITSSDKACNILPFFHCSGYTSTILLTIRARATIIALEQFKTRDVLKTISEQQCSVFSGVPTMYAACLTRLENEFYDLSSLRTGIVAGDSGSPTLLKAVIEKMGIRELCIAYGLTEASPLITMSDRHDPPELRIKNAGKALPGIEIKIADLQEGGDVPVGIVGELCMRGKSMMRGYYKMPEATAKTIDDQGWLHTGDLAWVDEQGYYSIVGRIKEMIIRGGENIYPCEIENYLSTHPKVIDAKVIGIPSDFYGEEVVAFVRVKEAFEVTEEEFIRFCQGKIASFKIPKYFFIVNEYPRTVTGKVKKDILREEACKILRVDAKC